MLWIKGRGHFSDSVSLFKVTTIQTPWTVCWMGTAMVLGVMFVDDDSKLILCFLGAFAPAESCTGTKFWTGSPLGGSMEYKQSILLIFLYHQQRHTHTYFYLCCSFHIQVIHSQTDSVFMGFFSLPPSIGFFHIPKMVQNKDVGYLYSVGECWVFSQTRTWKI